MSEVEMGRIKLGGFFGPSEKVIYELKYEHPTSEGEVKSISMYKDVDGAQLGKIEYLSNDSKVKLNVFTVMDWSSPKYGEALMLKFLKLIRKESARFIEHQMYDTDDKTHNKIALFRESGFSVESRGNITGYSEYYLSMNI